MKLGKLKIPDYVTTDSGEIIRSADLVAEIRNEFRDTQKLVTIDNANTTLIAAKASWIMRTKYKHYYMHSKSLPIFQAIMAFYVFTGRREFHIKEVHNLFRSGMSLWYFRVNAGRYDGSGYYIRKGDNKIQVTDHGISALNLYNKVYMELLEENKKLLWEYS